MSQQENQNIKNICVVLSQVSRSSLCGKLYVTSADFSSDILMLTGIRVP